MIKDTLKNAKTYYNLSNNLKIGLEWLHNNDLKKLADGRYNIDGNTVYASIQTYETKEDAKYESHRKYIDIQYMIEGEEKVGITDLSNCITCIEYDPNKDLEFYNIESKEEYSTLKTGELLILYPHDAHKPSISLNTKKTVKKVVVKVAI